MPSLTLMLSLLSSHLSIFMPILSPPSMVSPLNFHAKCSHLQAWSHLLILYTCQMLSPPSMTLPLNFHANTLTLQAWPHLSIFMPILWPPSMVSETSQFSCQYSHLQVWSHPYTLTAQPSPLNFHANTLISKHGLTKISILMPILSPPSMTLPLNFHANTLTFKHDLTSQFSCQYSHLSHLSISCQYSHLLNCSALVSQLPPSIPHPTSTPLNFHANTLTSNYGLTSQLHQTLAQPSPLNFDANALTSKYDVTSQFSCQMLSPPSMTLPLNFLCQYSHLQVWSHPYPSAPPLNFMLILSPPSMISPLNFHAIPYTLTSKHDLSAQFSCKYSHL